MMGLVLFLSFPSLEVSWVRNVTIWDKAEFKVTSYFEKKYSVDVTLVQYLLTPSRKVFFDNLTFKVNEDSVLNSS